MLGVGAPTVEVDEHDGACAWRDGGFDESVVNFQRPDVGFHKYGGEVVLGNGEDGGDVGVGRHYDFVAVFQLTQFLVGSNDEAERIQPVAARYAVSCSDVV